jgi:hypothetical protein
MKLKQSSVLFTVAALRRVLMLKTPVGRAMLKVLAAGDTGVPPSVAEAMLSAQFKPAFAYQAKEGGQDAGERRRSGGG